MRRPALDQRGIGLTMSLIVLCVFGIMATTTVTLLRTLKKDSVYQMGVLKAHSIAEAGAQDALRQLVSTASWRTGFNQKAFGEGYYTVTLSTHARPWVTSTGYARSVALIGRPVRTIKERVETELVKQYKYGVLSRKSLNITYPGRIDSYNSEDSTAPSVFGSTGTTWVNTSVNFNASTATVVFGNLTFYSGTAPSSWTVTGTIVDSTYTLPTPTVSGSSYTADNYNLIGFSPQSYYTPGTRNVAVPWWGTATLKSGIYYFNRLDIDGTLNIEITNGPVIIYFDANLTVTNLGKVVNPTKIPGNLFFYAQTVTLVDIDSTEPFYGVLDVQDADITIDSEVYGAVVGEDVVIENDGRVHFDRALERAQTNVLRIVPQTISYNYKKQ